MDQVKSKLEKEMMYLLGSGAQLVFKDASLDLERAGELGAKADREDALEPVCGAQKERIDGVELGARGDGDLQRACAGDAHAALARGSRLTREGHVVVLRHGKPGGHRLLARDGAPVEERPRKGHRRRNLVEPGRARRRNRLRMVLKTNKHTHTHTNTHTNKHTQTNTHKKKKKKKC